MMVPITAILTTGTVMLLRPITMQVGGLLEAMTQERKARALPAPAPTPAMAQPRDLLSAIATRLSRVEERQDSAEALMTGGERRAVASPALRTPESN